MEELSLLAWPIWGELLFFFKIDLRAVVDVTRVDAVLEADVELIALATKFVSRAR